MRRVLAAPAAAGLMLLAACSSGGGQPSSSPSASGTYTDPTYGYSLTVVPPFTEGNPAGAEQAVNPADTSAASTVTFYDPSQKVTQDAPPQGMPKAAAERIAKQIPAGVALYPVSFTVNVYPLRQPVTGDSLADAQQQLEKVVLPQLDGPGTKLGHLTDTTVAGRPAFTADGVVSGAAAETGQVLRTETYFVFSDSNEIQVTLQAPSSEWKSVSVPMEQMLKSLTVPGTWQSATPSPSASAS